MNPFEQPPAGDPVAMPAPDATPDPDGGPRRGRMAVVALLAAGLVAGGIAGVSQLASADQPELATSTDDEQMPPADDDATGDDTREDTGDDTDAPAPPPGPEGGVDIDGEIVIDTGDGEPVVIDLGELDLERLQECAGLPVFDGEFGFEEWEPGEGPFGNLDELFGDDVFGNLDELFGDEFFEDLPTFEEFEFEFDTDGFPLPGGGSVTVTGPDGVRVIELGENGSVTITKNGDEITVEPGGDATVTEVDELFGEFGTLFGDGFGEEFALDLEELLGEFDGGVFDEFLEGLPALDELPELEPIEPGAIQDCLDELAAD